MASRRSPVSSDKRFRQIGFSSDQGTPERWNHSGRVLVPTERAGVCAARATEEHVLDILRLKRFISQAHVQAGLAFKEDFHQAAIAARVCGSYSGASSARDFFRGEHERSEAEEAAYRRWRDAVRELGLNLSPPVIATVCHDATPRLRDLPALRRGLEKLAAWYKIPAKGALQRQTGTPQ